MIKCRFYYVNKQIVVTQAWEDGFEKMSDRPDEMTAVDLFMSGVYGLTTHELLIKLGVAENKDWQIVAECEPIEEETRVALKFYNVHCREIPQKAAELMEPF